MGWRRLTAAAGSVRGWSSLLRSDWDPAHGPRDGPATNMRPARTALFTSSFTCAGSWTLGQVWMPCRILTKSPRTVRTFFPSTSRVGW